MCKIKNASHKAPGENQNGMYVGRTRQAMHYGNPFSHNLEAVMNGLATVHVGNREIAVIAYHAWLNGTDYTHIEQERRKWILENLHELKGHDLICWCAPLRCHAEILRDLANSQGD